MRRRGRFSRGVPNGRPAMPFGLKRRTSAPPLSTRGSGARPDASTRIRPCTVRPTKTLGPWGGADSRHGLKLTNPDFLDRVITKFNRPTGTWRVSTRG